MNLRFSKSLQDFFNYMIAGGLARILPFLLLPYVAKVLTPEDFGFFSLYRLYTALGSVILLLGVEQGLFRLIPGLHAHERLRYLRAALSFILIFFIFLTVLSWPWQKPLNRFFLDPNISFPFLFIPLLILVNALSVLILTFFSACQESRKYLLGNLLVQGTFFTLFLSGLFLGWQLKAFFISFIAANLLLLFFNIDLLKSLRRLSFDWPILKRLLKTGFPLMLVLLLTYLLYQSDHYLIKFYLGVEQTGIYNYGYRFASMLLIFVVQSNNVWFPRIYARGEDFFKQHVGAYAALIALSCAGILWILLLLFHYFPSLLLPAGFEVSKTVLLIVGLGYMIYGQAQMIDGWLILKNKSNILVGISAVALAFNLIFNALFIPKFGILAAATITAFSFLLIWLAIIIYLGRFLNKKALSVTVLKTALFTAPFFLLFVYNQPLVWFTLFLFMGLLEFMRNPLSKILLSFSK
ncbi:oligosaccharide flippase family protein [Caldithrix abyssi]